MESHAILERETLIDFGPLQGRPDPRTDEEKAKGKIITMLNGGTLAFGLEALSRIIANQVNRGNLNDDVHTLINLQAELSENMDQLFFSSK